MRRLSLRLRLTLAFTLAIAAVLAAMSAFVFVRVHGALTAAADRDLRHQVADTVRHAGDSDRDTAAIGQVLDRHGRLLHGTAPALLTPGQAAAVAAGRALHEDAEVGGRAGRWRLLAERRSGVVVAAGESLQHDEDTLHHLAVELAIAVPIALLLASLGSWLLAAAALRPVEAMRRRAATISAETPGLRLPVPRNDDEIGRLGATLNEMLGRIEAAVEHERRFVADASHELRTPLALLRTELDLALRRPRSAEELEAALRSAAVEAERLSRIAEDLLLLARSEDGELPLQRRPVDALELLDRVAERFAGRAADLGRTVEVGGEPAPPLDADPLRVEQALDNLVENALRHGDGSVRLFARAGGGMVELHVADEGGGFPPAFLARAFERFTRADEARGRGGTGLGLAIVELIAHAHGGAAAAENGEAGADVWIAIPAAATRPARPAAPAGRAAP